MTWRNELSAPQFPAVRRVLAGADAGDVVVGQGNGRQAGPVEPHALLHEVEVQRIEALPPAPCGQRVNLQRDRVQEKAG